MSGALGSGKDIVIELSADYVTRILQSKFSELKTGCFHAPNVDIPYDGGTITLDQVRKAVLLIESVSFTHSLEVDIITDMAMVLNLRLVYAQVIYFDVFGDEWKTLDEIDAWLRDMDRPQLNRRFSYPLGLRVSAESERVVLSVDTSTLPDYLPDELTASLPENIPIPINFLNQLQVRLDEAGSEQVARILVVTLNHAEIKSIEGGHLAIGLDVELAQDEDLMVVRPGLTGGDGPIIVGSEDMVHHRCGLPNQPLITEEDILAFRMAFAESMLGGSDWAVALDKHIVDAILRGLPSVGMNEEGDEPREGCEHENATRGFCLRVAELEAGNIRVHANGEVFFCGVPTDLPIPVDALYNTFWEVCADANVTLTLTESRPRRLVAHYELTDVRPCGDDEGFNFWLDLFSIGREDRLNMIPARFRERDISLRDVPTTFGDLEDPVGQLTISETPDIYPDGLVLRGLGSIRAPELSISVAPVLLFASGCQEEGQPSATLSIQNDGEGHLYVCGLVLRAHPVPEHVGDVALFRVISPPELMEDGAGMLLEPGGRAEAVIECSGDPVGVYWALLDVPSAAGRQTVTLNADFRDAVLGPTLDEIRVGARFEKSGCNWPPYHSMSFDLEVRNEGPGNLEICAIRFSRNVREVFRASRPGVLSPESTAVIHVTFSPFFGDDAEYSGRMRILTNSGEERVVSVIGRNEYVLDWRTERLFGSYGEEMFCADADWDRVMDTRGRILDPPELERILSFLGGEDCCPRPRGPACLCVDLLEVTVTDIPPRLGLEVVTQAGEVIASDQSNRASRSLVTPFREGNGYALRATIPKSVSATGASQLTMRCWLVQQEGLYLSSQELNDVAVLRDCAYLVGSHGLEVVSLSNVQRPRRVALVSGAAGTTAVATLANHLLLARDRLEVYVISGGEPKALASLSLSPSIQTFASRRMGSQPSALAYGMGQALHVLDLSNLARPRKLRTVGTRVQANRAIEEGNFLYLFGEGGIEIFDLSKPEKPSSIQYVPTQRGVRNAFLSASSAALVYDSRTIDRVSLEERSRLQVSGSWRLENWMSEFVPTVGAVARYNRHLVLLTGNRSGMRILRLRRNKVDQEKLHQWRHDRHMAGPSKQ
ncbi:MAG: hypothetical protein ACU84H_12290 [Gammaproteobacteria bacterium]